MTPDQFRKIALSLPETVEASHMNHPDFRVCGKIFATLDFPEPGWGMVKLTPAQQQEWTSAAPEAFVPVKGGWGRQGGTNVVLKKVKASALREALFAAWLNAAPKRLIEGS
jgi:hypothetical protein